MILTSKTTANEWFSQRPLTKELGIYFEQVSAIRLYHKQWNLITYVNLSALQNEWEHIQTMVQQTNAICTEIITQNAGRPENEIERGWNHTTIENINCGPSHIQMQYLLNQIQEYNVEHFQNTYKRKKRGFLNVVGEIAKDLFGTLSDSDAQLYLDKLEKLNLQGHIRDEIMKKQSTLTQSTFNLITETRQQAEANDKQLTDHITQIREMLTKYTHDIHRFNYGITLRTLAQDLISFIILLLMSFQQKQTKFLQALSLGTKGGNSPAIIPPAIFYKELNAIRGALSGKSVDLPIALSRETLPLFYQIASPRSTLLHNQLIIALTIPLTDMELYNLYKVTSFPNRINDDLFQFIIPTHEYVALSRYSQRYVSFTNQELANCHNTYLPNNQTLLTCMEISPIMDITVNRDDCEITLLTKDVVSQNCDIRISNISSELWIKLRTPNAWIYVLPKTTMVRIDCEGNDIHNMLMNGTGILTIHEDCNIKTDNILIQAFKVYQHEILTEAQPFGRTSINISKLLNNFYKIPEFHIKKINTPSVITFGQNDKLKELSNGIQDLIQMEDALTNQYTPTALRHGINTMNTVIIIILIIISIIIFRILIKKHRRIRTKQAFRRYAKVQPQQVLMSAAQIAHNTDNTTVQEEEPTQILYPVLNQ